MMKIMNRYTIGEVFVLFHRGADPLVKYYTIIYSNVFLKDRV